MHNNAIVIAVCRASDGKGYLVELHDREDGAAEYRFCRTAGDVEAAISPYFRDADKLAGRLIAQAA